MSRIPPKECMSRVWILQESRNCRASSWFHWRHRSGRVPACFSFQMRKWNFSNYSVVRENDHRARICTPKQFSRDWFSETDVARYKAVNEELYCIDCTSCHVCMKMMTGTSSSNGRTLFAIISILNGLLFRSLYDILGGIFLVVLLNTWDAASKVTMIQEDVVDSL